MIHSTISLLKFKGLSRELNLPLYACTGVLESLWCFAQTHAKDGDLTRYSAMELAVWMEWEGDPNELFAALVKWRWLDVSVDGRVTIHDWMEHCPTWVKGVLARRRKSTPPPIRGVLPHDLDEFTPLLGRGGTPSVGCHQSDGAQTGGKLQLSSQLSREPSHEPSCQLSREPSVQLSSQPSGQLPNLTQPNLTKKEERCTQNPQTGGVAGKPPVSRSRKSMDPPKEGGRYLYPQEFRAVVDRYRPLVVPMGSLILAYRAWAKIPSEENALVIQAVEHYCDQCHRTKTHTKNLSSFLNEVWRDYIELTEGMVATSSEDVSKLQRDREYQSILNQVRKNS